MAKEQDIELGRLAWVGPLCVVASVAAVLLVRLVLVIVLQPAPQFTPLGWVAPALDTAILVTFAVLVFGAVASSAANPLRTFKRFSTVVLMLSLVPPTFVVRSPDWGGNWPNAIALMILHLTAWVVSVSILTKLTVQPSRASAEPQELV